MSAPSDLCVTAKPLQRDTDVIFQRALQKTKNLKDSRFAGAILADKYGKLRQIRQIYIAQDTKVSYADTFYSWWNILFHKNSPCGAL